MKKKLFIIGCTGVPARYGGFETFAENIALELSESLDVSVICSSKLYTSDERIANWNGINRIFYSVYPNGLSSIVYDLKGLLRAIKEADHILLLGVGSGLFLPLLPSLRRKNLLIHIDGIEWKRLKWNLVEKIYLRIGFWFSLRYAKTIILDNKALNDYVPDTFRKKTVTLNYGGNHLPATVKFPGVTSEFSYALVIARAEPENNLHLILRIFEQLQNLRLIIISNWNNNRYGKKLYRRYSGVKNIQLIDAIYDAYKLHQFRMNCTLYIHGHSVGGTNPSLVEAMYAGVPIIAFDNEFNRITTNNLAIYFKTIKDLEYIIHHSNQLKLSESAGKMKRYAMQNYTWDKTARKMMKMIDSDQENQIIFK